MSGISQLSLKVTAKANRETVRRILVVILSQCHCCHCCTWEVYITLNSGNVGLIGMLGGSSRALKNEIIQRGTFTELLIKDEPLMSS